MNIVLIVIGLLMLVFGGGLDVTVAGLPEGLTVQAIGLLLILAGLGRKVL